MGLGIVSKAFKKVFKGVKKVIKKGVKAVKKVVKKISSSKVLRTLATIAAVVVTGGAALGAFPGLASTQIGSAIVGAGNWISSVPVLGKAFVPFSKAGAFAGEALYTAGANLGFIKEADVAAKTLQAAGMDATTIQKLSTADKISQANAYIKGTEVSQLGNVATLTSEEIAKLGTSDILAGTTATPATFLGKAGETAPMTSFGGKAAQLTGRAVGALASPIASIGKQIAVGYGTAKLLGAGEGPQTGEAFGFTNEQKTQLDNLMVAQAQTGVDISKAYDQTFNFGTGDVGYLNNSLYQSPVLQV